MRQGLALACAVLGVLMAAPPAMAGTAAVDAGSFYAIGVYSAYPGETNAVAIRGVGPGMFVVADPGGAPIDARADSGFGGNCRGLVAAAECVNGFGPVPEVNSGPFYNPFSGHDVIVSLGDGDDTAVTLDGLSTRVSCGPGNDTVIVEAQDDVQDCERVDRR